jgi:hypothetical protein
MKTPIEFICPVCGAKALYFGGYEALCPIGGKMLYTDIPRDLIEKYKATKQFNHSSNGWMTVSESSKYWQGVHSEIINTVRQFILKALE